MDIILLDIGESAVTEYHRSR